MITQTITESPVLGGGAPLPSEPSSTGDFDLCNRFWRNVQKLPSCWLWKGCLSEKGYGLFWDKQHHCQRAHRVSWLIHNGEIPKGLMVCHTCDTRNCVNPDHLFLGTARDNNRDMIRKKRNDTCCKLSDDDVERMRGFYLSGFFNQRAIASMFRVHQSTVSLVMSKEIHSSPGDFLSPTVRHPRGPQPCLLRYSCSGVSFPADSHEGGSRKRVLWQQHSVGHRRATVANASMHSNNPLNRQAVGEIAPSWQRLGDTSTPSLVPGAFIRHTQGIQPGRVFAL